MAMVAQRSGSPEDAACLFGAAEAQRETIGASLTFVLTREDCEQSLGAVRAALTASCFDARWREGRAMALNQAVVHALALLQDEGRFKSTDTHTDAGRLR
jgi:hypothetical protein